MKNDQRGFSAIETILILVIVSLVGIVGWYVWQKRDDASMQSTTTSNVDQEKLLEAYQPTTTIPSDWKEYTNDTQMFSVSYPPSWEAIESSGRLGEASKAQDRDFFLLRFRSVNSNDNRAQITLDVTHETLDQAVTFVKDISKVSSAIQLTITNEQYFLYQGYKAVRLDVTLSDSNPPDSYTTNIYIFANSLLYKFATNSSESPLINDHDVLTVFESLKIQ